MTVEAFLEDLPFTPDPFQVEAIEAIGRGESVVVTAPTGAGKTVIAEASVELATGGGGRAFYTTPIKALSNQKYLELVERYGEDGVGLLTGDNAINGDAPVVVMTTEVLRNMIHARSSALQRLRVIVLDEVHYLGDRSRGAVWEEVIIHAPPTAQLVCLSATIANPEQLTDWIRTRRGEVHLVIERNRPVPLRPMYAMKDRWHNDAVVVHPLFVHGKPNTAIRKQLAARTGAARKGGAPPRRFVTPRRLETVEALRAEGMLPAIYFIFSRKGCAQAAATVAAGSSPRPAAVVETVRAIAERHVQHLTDRELSVLDYGTWLSQVERGVAAHHAGMVPAFKEAVEELFAAGLIDVVFATETLAVGINMPARSVVLENLTKFTGEAHEVMTASDYTQLTGRAGRRGIDDVGYGVILHTRWVRFDRVVDLAGAGASTLTSSFRPTYNMAVNLIANHDRPRAEELLRASLAQFQRAAEASRATDRVDSIRAELIQAREEAECSRGSVREYLGGPGVAGATTDWEHLRPGDVIDVPGGRRPGRYVLLKRDLSEQRLDVVSAGGKTARLTPRDLPEGSATIGSIEWSGPFRPRDRRFLQQTVQRLKRFRPRERRPLGAAMDERPAHPVHACPSRDAHVRAARRVTELEARLERLGVSVRGSLVEEFAAVIGLLDARGYVDGWELQPPGSRLRRIYSERDLLVSECLRLGVFESCDPPELAALVSAFVFDPRAEEWRAAFPTALTKERAGEVMRVWDELTTEERRRRLPETSPPEFGFAAAAYAWCSGVALDDLMDTLPITAGDFVRVSRQLLDLLRQVRDAEPALSDRISAAMRGIDRGIVSTGAVL